MKKVVDKGYISVYLRNHEDGPSCYYRVNQYIDGIQNQNIVINDAMNVKQFRMNMDFKFGLLKKVMQGVLWLIVLWNRYWQISADIKRKPKLIVVQREIFPRWLPVIIKKKYSRLLESTNVIWDFDDAICDNGEISLSEWKILSDNSDIVIATSNYLLDKVENDNTVKIVMPTTDGFSEKINLSTYAKERRNAYDNEFRLVWVGTHSNLMNIVEIIPYLRIAGRYIKEHGKELKLVVVCNKDNPILYEANNDLKVEYKKWTRNVAEEEILKAHLGLMPLPDTEWSKGKGGFKLIQYMSAGIPVLGSDIGINSSIIVEGVGRLIKSFDEWIEFIIEYALDGNKWKSNCINARTRYSTFYSYNKNRDYWIELVQDICNN